jgi:hypothetical protein
MVPVSTSFLYTQHQRKPVEGAEERGVAVGAAAAASRLPAAQPRYWGRDRPFRGAAGGT